MSNPEPTTARRPRRIRPEAPIGDDVFACEIAIALDAIENLTRKEAADVAGVTVEANCEPLLPFLALHFRLAHVLASPHGRQFRSALREWRANELLDVTLWRMFGAQYRPRYRPGAGTAADIRNVAKTMKDLDIIGATATPPATQTREQRREIVQSLQVGDVVRYRFPRWGMRDWWQGRVVEVTARGIVYACPEGRKGRVSISSLLKQDNITIEVADPTEVQ